ncbi:dTMP kinase [Mycoplasma todarodis]|uniref:dTMP kinase n=1 Tax=Mycoplasma todarodis TaxID=1937191 RepID=UPI0030044DA6
MDKPLFITFEGPDGSGKTTALRSLVAYLQKNRNDLDFIFTREPGGSKNASAEKVRNIILDKENIIGDKSEALLYAAARRLHLEQTIWPALKENKMVLCDRYIDSSLAYQGEGRGLGIEFVTELNNLATDNTWPDVTIFFDITPEAAMERASNRAPKDRLELAGDEFHQKVYKGYKKVIANNPERFRVIDATQSIEKVFEDVLSIIAKLI